MNQTNYLKILWFAAYLAFAAASCWATGESMRFLLPTWPAVICYIITVGFFVIASLGTKMIVDSFNQNIYVERRTLRFIGGVIITIIFWLVFSLPTNTHTFFYRRVINDKVTTDISRTNEYLSQIKENTRNERHVKEKADELRNKVDAVLIGLQREIMNEANPGQGIKAKGYLKDLAVLLRVDEIKPLSYRGTSDREREQICTAYRKMINAQVNARIEKMEREILKPDSNLIREASNMITNLNRINKDVIEGNTDLTNPKDMLKKGGVCDGLTSAYSLISNNRDFVTFKSAADEAKYTANNPVPEIRRMMSVSDVWSDFFKGEYAGYGFGICILISVLVDVAAFIFFNLMI